MDTTVLLVDDHAVFRMGLKLLLADEAEMQVVGEAGDGQSAIAQVQELSPDVVIMDISMPDMDGIETTRHIRSEFPQTKIIALSIHAERDFVENMLGAGATGYVLKESALEDLIPCIHAVRRGKVFLSASIKDVVVSQYMERLTDTGPLTDKRAPTPLLTSKLYPSRITRNTIPRTRLIEQLDEGLGRPLTLVSAPAGYGKSTLLVQWLEQCDTPTVWLSLDERDNDLRLFLTYLVAAVRTLFPEALRETSIMVKASNLPPLPVLVRTLVNDLDRLPQRFILVLDDYHRIDEPSIHELLGELLLHPLQSLHLVLASRTDPSLDLLQLRAYRQMGEVRAQGLSFTVEETKAFLEKIVGEVIEERIAEEITEKTEGWVTGLHLITLTVHDNVGLANLSTILPGEQQTLDYLAAEALSRQPRDVQDWLLKTSILDRFCAALCEAVCALFDDGEASSFGGDEFIHWLTNSNLFVISLDNHGLWFRYHHLFRELLQSQLESGLGAEDIADLHSRASHWFVENGLIEDAIKHRLEAGDVVGAAQIVENKRYAIQDEDKWFVLEQWLSMLPDSVKQQRPGLLMARTWLAFEKYDFKDILSTLEQIEQILSEDESNQPIWGEINFFKGYFYLFSGQAARGEECFSRALKLIPKDHQHNRSEAELQYMLALQFLGRKEEARQGIKQLLQVRHHVSAIKSTRYWGGLCFIHLLEGKLSEALYPARQLQALSSKHSFLYAESWGIYGLANAHLLQNNQEKAEQNLSWLFENRYIMHTRDAVDSICGLALYYQLTHQLEKVGEVTRLLFDYAWETNDPAIVLVAASNQARLSLIQGHIPSAMQWLQTADLSADEEIMLFWLEIPRLTACRVLVAEGSPESLQKAIEELRNYQKENEALHNHYQVIVLLPILALAYDKLGQNDKALLLLEETLALANPGGWIWPFIELGTPMASLLKRLKLQGVARSLVPYIDLILAAFPSPAASGQPELITPLTKRELEVLYLLVTELSAGEIAEQLVVSVNTVRAHTKNIYSKLDVHSRIDAVERARELELI